MIYIKALVQLGLEPFVIYHWMELTMQFGILF